jgi:hypothetical protein
VFLALALAALCAIPGCVPERVAWSPDGMQAAVIGSDGLHLCDPAGKMGAALIPGQVQRVAWLPDGKRVVVVREASYATFKEAAVAVPGLAKTIENKAKVARAKLVASGGDEASLQDPQSPFPKDEARLIVMYLRDNDPTLRKDLGNQWDKIADMTYDIPECEVYDISDGSARKRSTLMLGRTGWSMEVRPSPTGAAVAVTMWEPNNETTFTMVSPINFAPDDDAMPLGETCAYPDWSLDGKSLVYVEPPKRTERLAPEENQEKTKQGPFPRMPVVEGKASDVRFGTLVRQAVIGEDGKLIEDHRKLPPEEGLAGMVYEPMGRVRVAKDGRIFFTSREVQLPATAADLPTAQSLFFIQPGKQATVSRAAPRSVEAMLGNQLQLFELSPDGAYVAVPSDHGQVSVLNLAKGEVQAVQPMEERGKSSGDWTLQSAPTWRSATELTFVRPPKEGSTQREVVLHSMADGSEKVLSADWPMEARDGWLSPDQAVP